MWADLDEEPFYLLLTFSLKTPAQKQGSPLSPALYSPVEWGHPLFNPEGFYSKLEELGLLPGDG